jgi:hypothetical protein
MDGDLLPFLRIGTRPATIPPGESIAITRKFPPEMSKELRPVSDAFAADVGPADLWRR